MKLYKLALVVFLFSLILSPRIALGFTVNSESSTVSFATIKLNYVVEAAYFTGLEGGIDNQGKLNINVPIGNIETGIGIRNQRLNDLFFMSSVFPNATVTADLPMELLTPERLIQQKLIPVRIGLYGKEIEKTVSVNVVKLGNIIAVSSTRPVIVDGGAFGIPIENLNALSATVGGIPLSDKVPVSFSLMFEK